MLVACVFARQVWSGLLGSVELRELVPQPGVPSFEAWWLASSQQLQGQTRSAFNSLAILGAWVIWKHRNECVSGGGGGGLPAFPPPSKAGLEISGALGEAIYRGPPLLYK
jgi:hypothetical protein